MNIHASTAILPPLGETGMDECLCRICGQLEERADPAVWRADFFAKAGGETVCEGCIETAFECECCGAVSFGKRHEIGLATVCGDCNDAEFYRQGG